MARNPTQIPSITALAVAVAGALVGTASAQELPDAGEPEALQEITVTGYRLLDTPLQHEAVSASSLKEDVFRNAASTARIDVLRTVPGLTVLELGGRSTMVIRGTSTAPDGDPNGAAVASYMGEVALSGLSGSRENVDLGNYDIERIDVLRGPQGFGYGAGAMAGVVRTVPNPPDTSAFSANVAVASRYVDQADELGYEVDGYVNVPLIRDRLALRVTGYDNREANPIWSTRYDQQGGPATVRGGRLSLRYTPNEDVTIDLRHLYEDRGLMDLTRTVASVGEYATSEAREPDDKLTNLTWLTANWDLGFATATYVGSYLDADDRAQLPLYYTLSTEGAGEVNGHYRTGYYTVTQELRLANADRESVDWTAGAYWEERRMDEAGRYFLMDSQTPVSTEYDFDGLDDPVYDNYYGSEWRTDETQASLFGELSYWINGKVGLTAGLRYVQWEASSGFLEYVEGQPETPPEMIASFPDSGEVWGQVGINWAPAENQLYYAEVSQVSRPGGTNYGAIDPSCAAEYADRIEEFYVGDQIDTFEVGAKLSGFGGKAVLNASAYYSRWHDAPTYTGVLCAVGVQYYIDNAGVLDLYGIELDAQARLTPTLTASMSAAYAVTEIDTVAPSFTGGVPGDRTPGNPDWKVSASLDYNRMLASGHEFFAGTGFSYTGRYKNGLSVDWSTFAPYTTYPGLDVDVIGQFPSGLDEYRDPGSGDYFLADARIGLASDRWTATLFGDNLFGLASRSMVNYLNITPAGEATYTRVTPRTVGLRVEYRF
jgi:outer membrane receptor protein involved in Fe transport